MPRLPQGRGFCKSGGRGEETAGKGREQHQPGQSSQALKDTREELETERARGGQLELESGGEDKIGRKDTGEGRGGKSVGGGGEIGIERMESSGGLEEGGDGGAGAVRTDGVGGEKGKESGFRATMRNILSLVKGKILVRDVDVGGMSVRDVGDQVDYGEEAVEMEEFLHIPRVSQRAAGADMRRDTAAADRRVRRSLPLFLRRGTQVHRREGLHCFHALGTAKFVQIPGYVHHQRLSESFARSIRPGCPAPARQIQY